MPAPSVDFEKEEQFKQEVRRIVLKVVEGLPCRVFLFGSRVQGKIRRSSDFDIGIQGLDSEIFWKVKSHIQDAVEESRVLHEVDIVNFDQVDEDFSTAAKNHIEVWKIK